MASHWEPMVSLMTYLAAGYFIFSVTFVSFGLDLVPGAWYSVPGTRCLLPGTKCLVPGTLHRPSSAKYLAADTWYLVPGT